MRAAMLVALTLLALGAATDFGIALAAQSTRCIPSLGPVAQPTGMRIMSEPDNGCGYLVTRATTAHGAGSLLLACSMCVALASWARGRWRIVPVVLVSGAILPAVFLLVIYRSWDPSCGAIDSHFGPCAKPAWILGPPVALAFATIGLLVDHARR